MKPICVPCHRFFRMKKAGFYFLEGMPTGPHPTAAGLSEAHKWEPYKLWAGDRGECEGCGATILSGFGGAPLAIRHEDDFAEQVRRRRADQFQVNDC